MHCFFNSVTERSFSAQTNENSKNSVEIGGDQELLQGRGELEDIEDGKS